MENLDIYIVDLKGIKGNVYDRVYTLDNNFFENIGTSEIRGGTVTVSLSIRKTTDIMYVLDFHIEGSVVIACDRCLDDMSQPIHTDGTLKVKLSAESLESDDLIVIPEESGEINIAWYMYEFIELNIPLKHVHASGECNEQMLGKLNEYLCLEEDVDFVSNSNEAQLGGQKLLQSSNIDPRWNELKKIIDNN